MLAMLRKEGKMDMRKEARMDRRKKLVIGIYMLACLMPLLLLPFFGREGAESGEQAVRFPSVWDGKKINGNFSREMGDYFSANFAFRKELVTLKGVLMEELFHSSSNDQVIVGKEDVLFYESSIADYTGKSGEDVAAVKAVARNLALMEKCLQDRGIRFCFTVAPNKNSLYPEYMPDRYSKNEDGRFMTKLDSELQREGISYVDLFSLFRDSGKMYYHKRDSHWNNQGAVLVEQTLLTKIGFLPGTQELTEERKDFTGDLDQMIRPKQMKKEWEFYDPAGHSYETLHKIQSNYDPYIETNCSQGIGNLVLYRDSFGNSLLPFMADQVERGIFSRSMPVDPELTVSEDTDVVIVEIVERNLKLLAEHAPVLASERINDLEVPDLSGEEEIQIVSERRENMLYVEGEPGENAQEFYLQVTDGSGEISYYPMYHTLGEHKEYRGAEAYLKGLETGDYTFAILQISDKKAILSKDAATVHWEEPEETEKPAEEEGKKHSDDLPIARSFIGKDVKELIEKIGEPKRKSLGASCATEGEDGQYYYPDFTVYTQSETRGGTQIIQSVEEQ